MIKENLYIGIIFIVLTILQGCNSRNHISDKTIKWMENESEIVLPPKNKMVDNFAYNEWGKLVKYKLTKPELIEFINKYELYHIDDLINKLVIITDIEKDWEDISSRNISKNEEYWYKKDCNDNCSWSVLIDLNSGYLWFEVLYINPGDCDLLLKGEL